MSLDKVVSKPAPTPVARQDPAPASTQDASAFAARIKKANAEQQARNARVTRRDDQGARAADRVGDGGAATERQECGESAILAVSQRQQQQQGSGDQSGESLCGVARSDRAHDLDADFLVDQLAPLSANDGMFEVLLPSGTTLAVAVKTAAHRVQILIGCDSANLGDQLKRKKMELEQRLGRRIGKDVVLAIL